MRYSLPQPVMETLNELADAGYPAYLVGGCVRDDIMGTPPHDYDICTSATPQEAHACFQSMRILDTGIRHGTVTLLRGGMQLEITTFREDGEYSDARHPDSVRFTRDIRSDLSRRDFTMNAIAWSPRDGFVDPFGGYEDITRGVIRCVGDPVARFGEDALRILRGIRFSACLGFQIDEATARAMDALRGLIDQLSMERVENEFSRLLCGEGAATTLRNYSRVVFAALPELEPMLNCPQQNRLNCFTVWEHTLHTVSAVPPIRTLRWTALLHDMGKPATHRQSPAYGDYFLQHPEESAVQAQALLTRLKMSTADIRHITCLCRYHDANIEPGNVQRYLAILEGNLFDEWLSLKRADFIAHAPCVWPRLRHVEDIRLAVQRARESGVCATLRAMHINGTDLKVLGFEGANIREALSKLLGMVQDGLLPNDPSALRDAATRECLTPADAAWLADACAWPRSARILDVACGNGQRALLLARMGFTVTAVDAVPEALLALREAQDRDSLIIRSCRLTSDTLPFAADAFDAVLLSAHADIAPKELERVLRPGGTAVLGRHISYRARKESPAPLDRSAIGRRVHLCIDRPMGSLHPHCAHMIYPIHYGYVPDVIGGDGEPQDAYLLHVSTPVQEYDAVITAVIHRFNDNEDKWVAVPVGDSATDEEIISATRFTEQLFDSVLIR